MDNNSNTDGGNGSDIQSNSYISESQIIKENGKNIIFERLLKDEKNWKYNRLIYNIKNNKKSIK